MANIKKGARAYYADTDYRRDGMNEAYNKIDSMPSIPTPTSADAGKVLGVDDNGEWKLENIPKEVVIASLTLDQQSGKYVPSITAAEFDTLINNDVEVIFKTSIRYMHINMIRANSVTLICFDPYIDNNTIYAELIWVDLDRTTWLGTSHSGYITLQS